MENLQLLSKVALSFQNLDDFDDDMHQVLEDVGTFMDISRIYIIYNETDKIMKNTFEWCSQGVVAQIDHLQEVHYEDVPSWYPTFINHGHLCSDDIMTLPKDIIAALEPQGIKSILVYPLWIDHKIKGFVGFDECKYKRKWKKEELKILSTISGIITNAYQRKAFQEEIVISETNFRSFFEIIDDMFIISDLGGRIIHCNESLMTKTGYSFLELTNMNIIELHPVDQRADAAAIVDKMLRGDTAYCPLEVESKSGKIYAVETKIWFGKWDKKDCIYSISKDITKERESSQLVTKIFERNPVPMAITSVEEKRFTKVNSVFLKKIGYREEEVLGKTVTELNLFNNERSLIRFKNKINNQIEIKEEELVLRCKDGSRLDILLSIEEITNQGIKSYLSVFLDITTRKKAEKTLEESRKSFSNFFSIGLDLFCITDTEGQFLKVNDAWKEILGYSQDDLIESDFRDFIHPEDVSNTVVSIEKISKGESVPQLINRYVDVSGIYHSLEWRAIPYGRQIYAAARDVTERMVYEEKILEISNRDPLTNVYNRRYIFNHAEEIIKECGDTGKGFCICLVDIDHFKKINDIYGHQAGDYILKQLTHIINENLCSGDLLGRYGGEEFIIIFKAKNKIESSLIMEKILNIIRNKIFIFDGVTIQLTFSGGVAYCAEAKDPDRIMDDLIKIADQRMYDAKKRGRNNIMF